MQARLINKLLFHAGMPYKVCKFGGSSLATRELMENAIDVMLMDDARKVMVVSAPGTRPNVENDTKVTKLLLRADKEGYNWEIKDRIREIGEGLGNVVEELCDELDKRLNEKRKTEFPRKVLAFGEYASARIIAEIAQRKGILTAFLDPKDFNFRAVEKDGYYVPDPGCGGEMGGKLLAAAGLARLTVIPGFYAYDKKGNVVTFQFGGSDITQGWVGRAMDAELCENFTDVLGLMRADPRIVPEAEVAKYATYEETRELGGLKLHKDAVVPLMERYIPMMVRSSQHPEIEGTTIVCDRIPEKDEYILGILKQEGFTRLRLKKVGVDAEIGFGAEALAVLAEHKIPYKHFPSVTDLATLVVHEGYLMGDGVLQDVSRELRARTGAEVVRESKIDTIVVAGVGMQNHIDTNARIFGALGKAGIPQLMVDASTPISIVIGVPEGMGNDAVKAVYHEFYK